MIAVGCTGGIGSGKSQVVARLATRGATVIVADELARRVLDGPGPALDAVRSRFGDTVFTPDGALDRRALGTRVFADPADRSDLEAIVHPRVHLAIVEELERRRSGDEIVVLELPLLVETGARERYRLDGVLVVDAPVELAVARLVGPRRLSEDEARARIAAQVTPDERRRAADFIIMNVGTLDELEEMVELAWRWMRALAPAAGASA